MSSHSRDVLTSLSPAVPAKLAELAAGWTAESPAAEPRRSASVVLCRDGKDGLETFLLHRHGRMRFAASMAVFPGGGVDPVDFGSADPLLACAVRETREETGVELDEAALLRWAHWITPMMQPIRYDTHFYVAALPVGQTARDTSTETERAAWTAPGAALSAYAAGSVSLMPPTFSILTELTDVSSVADLLVLASDRTIETVQPEVVRDGDGISETGWVYRYPPAVRRTPG
jgi:8-oxo-dGTP pyrophosphatase MutT (NUDIX family)